jgi:two-component system, chemotaxis family, protein-glutamate methylesterase/glutaminase
MSGPRAVIAIGASAGGVEALQIVVRGLPPDLDAAVFVVLHVPPYAKSRLPEILNRIGGLPAGSAEDGEPIAPGRIYVAPPDRHLLVRSGRIELSKGPRENHSRPAIDPLFRAVARAYGSRAIGVILSGALYDGSAGLLAIKAHGGVAVVQDPAEAMVAGMPSSALRLVEVDHVAAAAEIGPLLSRLVAAVEARKDGVMNAGDEPIDRVIDKVIAKQALDDRPDDSTIYTCPDCGGVMFQSGEGASLSFACHVGHAYAPELLLGQKAEELEAALWTCVRMLTEKATLTRQVAARMGAGRNVAMVQRSVEQAELAERQARVVRDLLVSMPGAVELVESVTETTRA